MPLVLRTDREEWGLRSNLLPPMLGNLSVVQCGSFQLYACLRGGTKLVIDHADSNLDGGALFVLCASGDPVRSGGVHLDIYDPKSTSCSAVAVVLSGYHFDRFCLHVGSGLLGSSNIGPSEHDSRLLLTRFRGTRFTPFPARSTSFSSNSCFTPCVSTSFGYAPDATAISHSRAQYYTPNGPPF
mmetsp:Transcript_30808/g.50958  ORF Transcript_30808/g.50958 Transcript_30808/m.50958 type:complete len:184 (+) Transcript_30808:388-939(+)